MNVLIVGGGGVGYYLAKTLRSSGHNVSVLEEDEATGRNLARDLDVLVVRGDGSKVRDLADAGADQAEVVAAVTGRDEDNLVVCQLAKRRFGVAKTIARVKNPANEKTFRKLGVDVVVSSTSIIASSIEQGVSVEEVRTVLALGKRDMFLIRITVSPHSPVINREVRDMVAELPDDCILVTIVRGDKALIPRGATVVKAGDEVFALASSSGGKRLREILTASQDGWLGH
jgi:trk system potassium uptake protein TrkA